MALTASQIEQLKRFRKSLDTEEPEEQVKTPSLFSRAYDAINTPFIPVSEPEYRTVGSEVQNIPEKKAGIIDVLTDASLNLPTKIGADVLHGVTSLADSAVNLPENLYNIATEGLDAPAAKNMYTGAALDYLSKLSRDAGERYAKGTGLESSTGLFKGALQPLAERNLRAFNEWDSGYKEASPEDYTFYQPPPKEEDSSLTKGVKAFGGKIYDLADYLTSPEMAAMGPALEGEGLASKIGASAFVPGMAKTTGEGVKNIYEGVSEGDPTKIGSGAAETLTGGYLTYQLGKSITGRKSPQEQERKVQTNLETSKAIKEPAAEGPIPPPASPPLGVEPFNKRTVDLAALEGVAPSKDIPLTFYPSKAAQFEAELGVAPSATQPTLSDLYKQAAELSKEQPTIPETKETIGVQLESLKQGRNKAVLIPEGTEMPALPKGTAQQKTPFGVFIFNPLRTKRSLINEKVADGSYGELLGHLEPKSPQATETVTATLPNGVEAKTSIVSRENILPQAEELKKQFPEANIQIGGEELAQDVLNKRFIKPYAGIRGRTRSEIGAIGNIEALKKAEEVRDQIKKEADERGLSFLVIAKEKGLSDNIAKQLLKVGPDSKIRGLTESIQKSKEIPQEVKDMSFNVYDPQSNPESIAMAMDNIAKDPELAITNALKRKSYSAVEMAEGLILAKELSDSGRTAEAVNIYDHLAENSTSAGQAIQILSRLSDLSEEGVLLKATKEFRRRGKKLSEKDVTDIKDLLDVVHASEGDAKMEATVELYRKIAPKTLGDKMWHLYYSKILSGPFTHAKNIIGNASSLALEMGTKVFSPTEIAPAMYGAFRGLVRGGKEAAKIIAKGDLNKFQEGQIAPVKFTGLATPLQVTHIVGRLLSAEDALAKNIAKGIEAGSLSKSEFYKLKGFEESFNKNYGSEATQAYADKVTYNQNPEYFFGDVANAINRLTNKQVSLEGVEPPTTMAGKAGVALAKGAEMSGRTVAKLIVPFTRVVANVTNNSIDYTPMGFLRAASDSRIKPERTSRQIKQQLHRAALGTMAMSLLATIGSGNDEKTGKPILTGMGPRDKNKRQQLESTGWKANSILIGGKYYPYQLAGPLALPMAIVGNYLDATRYTNINEKDLLKRLNISVLNAGKSILDMSFLSNVNGLVQAIDNGSSDFLTKFVINTANPVPALITQTARAFDPVAYETKDVNEMIQNSIAYTNGLKVKINVWGEPIKINEFSGLGSRAIKSDPVKDYLAENNIFVSMPLETSTIKLADDTTRQMTRDEYYDYIKNTGPLIYQELKDNLDEIKLEETQEDKKALVDKLANKIRKDYRETYLNGKAK